MMDIFQQVSLFKGLGFRVLGFLGFWVKDFRD
jgi:preprotein translocase subunit Sss1